MGRISTGIGLVSGINSKDIIDQLMSLESRPVSILQNRVDSVNQQKLAFSDLQARLSSIQIFGQTVGKPQAFSAATTTSSDANVITGTASAGAAIGSFQFQVARLVTTQQAVSSGFTAVDAKVGAGTITIEQGGGEVNSQTLLSQLNGGQGIRRGLFRITDGGGHSAVIDTTAAVSVSDVIKKINTSLDISVHASISGDQIKLTDTSGLTTTPLSVTDLADGNSAKDLGLAGATAVAGVITGNDINYLSAATTLNAINDGRGIRKASIGNDIAVTAGGTTYNIALASAKTLADVFDLIKTGTSGAVTASVDPGSNAIKLTGSGAISVADIGDSKAGTDLGLVGSGSGTLTGGPILAGINTILVSSLNGGSGLNLGSIQITNGLGTPATVDLSGAKNVQDILDKITNSGLNVKADLNASGNGIQVTDNSGGTSALTIAEAGGTTAADLGLLGTAAAGTITIAGKNLQRQWVSQNTLLADYNGGKGVTPGSFKITNSNGVTATIKIDPTTKFTLGDVIRDINSKGIGVTASVNAHGDGLLLTDASVGGLKLKVENVDGTSATDLNIEGTSTGTDGKSIDGSFEKTLTVTAADTLGTVQQKLTDLNFGVAAQLISDGSATAPFRLSLTAKNAGRDGRVVFDAGATTLGTRNLVESQDAAVFVGSSDNADPLLVTASKNQLSGLIRGVTIDLHGTSTGPVTLNVTRDIEGVVTQVKDFTDAFNGIVDKIADLTKFDPATQEQGLLLGDDTVQTVQSNLYNVLNSVVSGAGRYRILADVGITLGDGAKITFDEDKFRAAYADDPDAVKNLFTDAGNSLGDQTPLTKLNSGNGVRALRGGENDFKIGLRDGTSVNVSLTGATTVSDIINAINTAAGAKLKASLRTDGQGLRLTDLTGSTSATLKVTALSGSQAAYDLGITGGAIGPLLDGTKIIPDNLTSSSSTGFGISIAATITKLVDPVSGVIPRENQTLDDRTKQFTDRITQLNELLDQKRTRLETQFSNMETVLAGLQSQQSALGSLTGVSASAAKK